MGSRKILLHSPEPSSTGVELSSKVVSGCWFELLRQGGCGAGELQLSDAFTSRNLIEIGDWISCEVDGVGRWYLGRVERREALSPGGVRFRLEGMAIELNEVFPGGFGTNADGVPPHRYASADSFPHDPDHSIETADTVAEPIDVVRLLLSQYIVPATSIQNVPALVAGTIDPVLLDSLKFRGEESARSILKELAIRSNACTWGVNEQGEFFFKPVPETTLTTFREGVDCLSLTEERDRELIFNRLLLTGDYIYEAPIQSGSVDRISYRWRGNYVQPESRAAHGERRIKLWLPWIRTEDDSQTFAREFFRLYSQPTSRYEVEVLDPDLLLKPWEGAIRLEDANGVELITASAEKIRVSFDGRPRLRIEIGPLVPSELWPEPPQDERWELPPQPVSGYGGGEVSLNPECDPNSIAGLELQFRAEDLSGLSDGDDVASWSARLGGVTATEGTASARPTFQDSEVNGLPVVRGDGADDLLTSASAPAALLIDDWTWFIVATPQSLANDQPIFRIGGAAGEQGFLFHGGNALVKSSHPSHATPDHHGGFRPISIGTTYVYSLQRDTVGGFLRSWQNGQSEGGSSLSSSTADYGTSPDVMLFSRNPSAGDEFGAVDIAEVLVYSRLLSTSEREQVETCLMEKYGITV